jgi:hypothetical protein
MLPLVLLGNCLLWQDQNDAIGRRDIQTFFYGMRPSSFEQYWYARGNFLLELYVVSRLQQVSQLASFSPTCFPSNAKGTNKTTNATMVQVPIFS